MVSQVRTKEGRNPKKHVKRRVPNGTLGCALEISAICSSGCFTTVRNAGNRLSYRSNRRESPGYR
ncbi:unnamed protein product [Prunus armeniaca]